MLALGMSMLSACADSRRGVIAQSAMVSLDLSGTTGSRVLRLDAAPRARINAVLPPVLELRDGQRLVFDGERTVDSNYFVASPHAALGDTPAGSGTLRASVCPADARVCMRVVLDVELPR
jgi:hypothetical protein